MRKRGFDVVASVLGMIVLSPIFLIVALLIKITSEGPIYFRQTRVGRNGIPFRIHKFRTMVEHADRVGEQLTGAGDSRITRVGKILRDYKLDELPQLIDVLRGDMSVVGPRPEVPRYVAHYPGPLRDIVLSVRPGITDMASVRFRDESVLLIHADNADYYTKAILPEKLRYYVQYVEQQSFRGDMKIIWLTVASLFKPTVRVKRSS